MLVGQPGPATTPYAVVTALAVNLEHNIGPGSAQHTAVQGLKLLDRLGCALRGPLNYQGDAVALLHGVLADKLLDIGGKEGALRREYMRFRIVNVTDSLKARLSEVMSMRNKTGKLYLPVLASSQKRRDGWATMLKQYAWRLVEYKMLLLVDLDVLLVETPLRALTLALSHGVTFCAAAEKRIGYTGVRTHLVLLRPSVDMFTLLMGNALSGHWQPYTSTEQDVIESHFPPLVLDDWYAASNPPRGAPTPILNASQLLPRHMHWGFVWMQHRAKFWTHGCPASLEESRQMPAGPGWLNAARYVTFSNNKTLALVTGPSADR